MALTTKPLAPATWPDFERLAGEHHGVWDGCWCCGRLLKRLVVASTVVMLLAAAGANAANRVPLALVLDGSPHSYGRLEVRPAYIAYGLSMGLMGAPRPNGAGTGRLRWTSWTNRQALGSGYDWEPDTDCPMRMICGADTYRARIRLWRPREIHGYWLFTRLTITYTKRRPPYTGQTRTVDVLYVSGGFNWNPIL